MPINLGKVRMAAVVQAPGCSVCAGTDAAGGVRYVARQPILDLHGRVHGYELLFRNGIEDSFRGDGDAASQTMIDNTVVFGLGRLTNGLPAFVNCTAKTLTDDLIHMLPAGMTVLEILETVDPTPELVEACRELKAKGYRLALDDFTWRQGVEPLVQLADYIKVDFCLTNCAERRELLSRLTSVTVALVAEKVETQEQYQEAREEGFTLIQGYYFCRPTLLENYKVPANHLSQVEILKMLQDDSIDMQKLALLVKRDASLTYRLLRLINSPVCAMRQEVRSVKAALLAVGEETFRRLATLAIASELNSGQSHEILRTAFVRARFCELAAGLCDLDRTEQYLLGLLSLLPAMLRMPMKVLAPSLPLREEIRQALLGKKVPERALLCWLEGHERGNWSACDLVEARRVLKPGDLQTCYDAAVVWAEAALSCA
ncbi:MAG: EAL and HDOD domain-containing protein [Terracidiphilus sp.]